MNDEFEFEFDECKTVFFFLHFLEFYELIKEKEKKDFRKDSRNYGTRRNYAILVLLHQ